MELTFSLPIIHILVVKSTLSTILIANPTLVHQHSKTSNLLISNSLLDIRSQTVQKLLTLRSLSIHSIVMRTILNQLLKSCSILSHGSITLLQLKKFHLFLSTHIFWKIVLQKCITKKSPRNFNTFLIKFLNSVAPPIFNFLLQHMSTKLHLLRIRTIYNSEDLLNCFHPCLSLV